MDIDIRKNIYKNLKGESENSIIKIIDESVSKKDELTLPGMGVLLELIWNECEKEKIAKIIKNKLQKM